MRHSVRPISVSTSLAVSHGASVSVRMPPCTVLVMPFIATARGQSSLQWKPVESWGMTNHQPNETQIENFWPHLESKVVEEESSHDDLADQTVITDESMHCRECGYSLYGLSRYLCPECGKRFDPEDDETFVRGTDSGFVRFLSSAANDFAYRALVTLVAVGWLFTAYLFLSPVLGGTLRFIRRLFDSVESFLVVLGIILSLSLVLVFVTYVRKLGKCPHCKRAFTPEDLKRILCECGEPRPGVKLIHSLKQEPVTAPRSRTEIGAALKRITGDS